jgi:APA family basic amino acid/polyamine antiporter
VEEGSSPEFHRGRRPGDVFFRRPRPRRITLHRVLGVPGLFGSAYGNVGSSIYYALGVTALFALGLTPLVFIVSGIFFGATALTYAEGTAALPQAGGSTAFARRAFNPFIGFVVGWSQLLNYVVTVAISAFAVANYLAVFWSPLGDWPVNSLFGIGVVLLLTAVNVMGVSESSRVNIILALVDLLTQVLLVVLGLVLLFSLGLLIDNVIHPAGVVNNISLGTAPSWDRLLLGIAISMIAYTGIETVSNLSEETKNPAKNIPRSVGLVFVAVIVLYSLLPAVALTAMPVSFNETSGEYTTELSEEYIDDPVLGIVENLPAADFITSSLEVWVGILAATILFIATNAGMLGMSRLAYSMGKHDDLPPAFSRLHPVRRTPAAALLIFGVLSALLIIPGQVEILAGVYVFGAMLSFTFAHASIIGLRIREPGLDRPFRIPVNLSLRGRSIPVTAILGGMATMFAWFIAVGTQGETRIIGFSWLALGFFVYLSYRWYKRKQPPPESDDPAGPA